MNKEEVLKQACHFVSIAWPLDQDQVLRLYQQVEAAKNSIAPDEYKVGVETMAKVFKPAGLTNISDLQAVFDAVELALTAPNHTRPLDLSALERLAMVAGNYDEPDANGPFPDIQDAMVTVGDLRKVRNLLSELSPQPEADGCKYRLLKLGEIIEETDELLMIDAVTWRPLKGEYSVGKKYTRTSLTVRRPLPASPGASDQSDAEAIAENELQEIADGAWGDNPRTRGLARDRLNATRQTGGRK